MAYGFVVNNKYKFNILNSASVILGGLHSNMKLVGIGIAETFYKDSTDIYTTHETLKSVIPNLPDIKDCMFYKFVDSYGAVKVFSDSYILESSIELSNTVNLVITIPTLANDMPPVIVNELKRLGINNATYKLV